jgi:ribosomal peptide maturation radical SAM protein 1
LIIDAIRDKRPGIDEFLRSLIHRYGLDRADIVGFTSMFNQNVASFAMARHLKEKNPKVITVIGGANCESPMGEEIAKNVDAFDFVFSGPALLSFPEFVAHCMSGQLDQCTRIRGVTSKKSALLSLGAPVIGEELSIDEDVALDYEPYLQELETRFPGGAVRASLPFETSRGCWWGERAHCTFCGLNGATMKYRAMNSESAVKLFESLFKFSPRVSRLEAVDNILPKEYLESVFPRLKTPAGMHMFYEVKADLSASDMSVLSNAGVKVVQPGIESLATATLKHMKKGTTAFNNLEFLKNCLLHDVLPAWNLLVGFPGEPAAVYEKYLRDLPRLVHLPPPTGAYPVRYDRFSPYFDRAKEYGLDLHPLAFYELIYPFAAQSRARLAYYFADHNYDAEYIKAMVQYIVPLRRLVESWRKRWAENESEVPLLYLGGEDGAHFVHDSRGEKALEYEIDDVALEILKTLDRRQGLSDLASALGRELNITETELKSRMDFLLGKGLLFEEGARFMSLVLPVRTQRPSSGAGPSYLLNPTQADRTTGTRDRKLDRVAAAAS